jgi:hypothetical protein
MISTPHGKKEELPQVIIDASAHIRKSMSLEVKVSELKKLYLNRDNLKDAILIEVTGTGLRFTSTEIDEAFPDFVNAMTDIINSKIQQLETEVQNMLSGNEAVKA